MDHINFILASCSKLLYALRVLHNHGLSAQSMQAVFKATVTAEIQYCSPAWSGQCSVADRLRLDAFLRRCKKFQYCSADSKTVAELFNEADDKLFQRLLANCIHPLQQHLTRRTNIQHSIRHSVRRHNYELITKTSTLNDRDYIIRMLYKDSN